MNLDDGEVSFVSCETLVNPTTVLVQVRDFRDHSSEWVTVIEATVPSTIEEGLVFGSEETPAGTEVVLASARPRPNETVALFVQLPGSPSSLHAEFIVPAEGVPENSWLRPSGEIWSAPCEP